MTERCALAIADEFCRMARTIERLEAVCADLQAENARLAEAPDALRGGTDRLFRGGGCDGGRGECPNGLDAEADAMIEFERRLESLARQVLDVLDLQKRFRGNQALVKVDLLQECCRQERWLRHACERILKAHTEPGLFDEEGTDGKAHGS